MIYLFTDKTTKKKTIFVKDISVLPTWDDKKIEFSNDMHLYSVGNKVFADISLFPKYLQGTDEDVNNIAQYFFQNCDIRKIDSADFFSSYITYLSSNL